ncbi:MAB_1171c family putative transporter [Frankia sp. R82]|uniref:MAB_1171c family putative transporter n=1 Tax=Frankia sp. R82 TaxID=2950553 RepID=UPI0020436535|nr:MAB_1171c family putative transporter [Frankia sp. R82]MCM3882287.1 hypothetical protein [Frankia sp. R82]
MQQLLHPICLALALIGFFALIWPPRMLREDRALAALAGAYALSAVSFVVSLEGVWKLLDAAVGRPSTGILVAFSSVVMLLALHQIVLSYWSLSSRSARRVARCSLAAAAVVVTVLAVLFFQLTPAERSTPQGFTANYDHTGVYQAFLATYIIVYIIGEAAVVLGCWVAARRTGQAWVRRGLYAVGTGAVLTFGYSGVRLLDVSYAVLGHAPPLPAAEDFAWICADGGTALSLAGFLLPTLAVYAIPHLRTWMRAQRDYRALAPLWEAVHRAVPTIALEPVRSQSVALLRVWNITWLLYRRVVEIRDGQWAVHRYLEDSVRHAAERRHHAAGLSGSQLVSAVTADQLAAALAAHGRDEAPRMPTEYADAGDREVTRTPNDDVRALVRIAAHFDMSAAS